MDEDKSKQKDSEDMIAESENQTSSKRQLLIVLPKSPTYKTSSPRMDEISRVYNVFPKRTQSLPSIKVLPNKTPLENLNLSHISQSQQENEIEGYDEDIGSFKHQEFSFKPKKSNHQSPAYMKLPKDEIYYTELTNFAKKLTVESPFRHSQANIFNLNSPAAFHPKYSATINNLLKMPMKVSKSNQFMSQSNTHRGNSLDKDFSNHAPQQSHEKAKGKYEGIAIAKKSAQKNISDFKSITANKHNTQIGQVVLRKSSLQDNLDNFLNVKPAGDILEKPYKAKKSPVSFRLPIISKHPLSKQSSVFNLDQVLIQSSLEVQDPKPATIKERSKPKFASFEEEVGHIARSTLFTKSININYHNLMKKTFDKRIDLRGTRIKFSEIYEKEAKKNGSSHAYQERIEQLFQDSLNDQLKNLISDFDKYKKEKKMKRNSTLKANSVSEG